MNDIIINTRCLFRSLTGVQRYTKEILIRLASSIKPIYPKKSLNIIQGHLWEQIILPLKLKNSLLFSPANSGPIFYKNQVVTLHDASIFSHPHFYKKSFVLWYRFLYKKLADHSAHIITDSKYSADQLMHFIKIPANKISVIYLGVDKKFQPLSKFELKSVLSKFNLHDCRYIFSLCPFLQKKNFIRLIEAWRIIYNKLPKDIWLVIGGGSYKMAQSPQFINNLPPRIKFLDSIDDNDLVSIYAGSLLFVFVSLYEGFGLPPLEAMSCGTPVLASNISAIPEILDDSAFFVDPYSITSIANGIKKMVDHEYLRKELTILGLNRAKQFNWDKTADNTVNLLKEINQKY